MADQTINVKIVDQALNFDIKDEIFSVSVNGAIGGDARYIKVDQTNPQSLTNGPLNNLSEPSFTYIDGKLSRIDYPSGYYKIFSYNLDGTLYQINYNNEYTKIFNYNLNGLLQSINIS